MYEYHHFMGQLLTLVTDLHLGMECINCIQDFLQPLQVFVSILVYYGAHFTVQSENKTKIKEGFAFVYLTHQSGNLCSLMNSKPFRKQLWAKGDLNICLQEVLRIIEDLYSRYLSGKPRKHLTLNQVEIHLIFHLV